MSYYFVYPFAVSGDTTPVDTVGADSGAMSWQAGFTPNYELDLATDPAALPVPRGQMNQIFNAITLELQNYQQHGVPNWITSTDNLGTSYPYDLYARVRYSATPNVASSILIYENQVQGNTATPGVDSTWLLISGEANGVPSGTIIDFAGAVSPGGYLACDGSAVSRSTYVTLFGVLTQVQTATVTNSSMAISVLTDTSQMFVGMTVEGTGIPSGTVITAIGSSTTITISQNATAGGSGVSLRFYNWCPTFNQACTLASSTTVTVADTSDMFVGMAVQGYGIPAGTVIATITPSTTITISNAATFTGASSLTFYSLGNGDGSTTFNVPSLNRKVTVASKGTPTSPVFPGSVLGMVGGEEVHTQQIAELAAHNHAPSGTASTFQGQGTGGSYSTTTQAGSDSPTIAVTGTTGSSTPFNVMQYGAVVNKIIKT